MKKRKMQSTKALQENQEAGGFSATTTTNAAVNHHLFTTPATTIRPCSATVGGSMTRSSPPDHHHHHHLHDEPCFKKPAIEGCFTKLPLPITFPSPSPSTSTLRRTISAPVDSLASANATNASPFTPFSHSSRRHFFPPSSPSPPNASPGLLRSISDPISLASAMKTRESPRNSQQRLEKMKKVIGDINQLFDQVIREDDEDEEEEGFEAADDDNNSENNKTGENCDSELDVDDDDQEAVSIEKNGGCLVVQFNCPCGKGYQILLSGNNCYYKLT